MKHSKYKIPNSRKQLHWLDVGEFEYSNPYEVFFQSKYRINLMIDKEKIHRENPGIHESAIDEFIYNKTKQECEIYYSQLLQIELPDGLLRILDIDNKDEQKNLLKDISLTSKEMQSFVLRAFSDYGYTYSLYSAEYQHKGLDPDRIPTFAFKDNDTIISSGDTDMTEGEMRQMIDHRKRTVSKFLDKGEKWHCFFLTYKSISGKELSYKSGQPHIHYISNAFGMTRERVLKELKSNCYKLSSAYHIDYSTHRNPK